MGTPRRPAAAALALALLVGAACTKPPVAQGLRFHKGQKLVYDIRDAEEAPHPVLGFGGKLLAQTRIEMSVLAVDADGSADVEATLAQLRMDGPTAAGVQVDTAAKRPLAADRTGSNSVVLSLVPQTAILRITRLARVEGRPNEKAAAHLAAWAGGLPPASGPVVQRIAERVDPVLAAQLVFGSVELLLARDPGAAEGEPWRVALPLVDSPAGRLRARATVTWNRSEDGLELHAKGEFSPAGDPPGGSLAGSALAEFVSGSIDISAKLGADDVFVYGRDTSRVSLRTRDAARTDTVWVRDHIVHLAAESKR